MPDPIDPYKILQVDSEAEDEVIQAAYRRLARKYHPDMAATPDLAGRMEAINAAWELIGEPEKRAAYDSGRLATPTRPDPPPAAPVPEPEPTRTSDTRGTAGTPGSGAGPSAPPREPDTVSRDWTSGRSTHGSVYNDSMRAADGFGAAGPPPGRPSGTVLNFGRYAGWSLGEVARQDIEYIEWLDRAPIGRNYREELDGILRASGRRKSSGDEGTKQRGLFRRR
jgi:curved DNA-binding protein CbpA